LVELVNRIEKESRASNAKTNLLGFRRRHFKNGQLLMGKLVLKDPEEVSLVRDS